MVGFGGHCPGIQPEGSSVCLDMHDLTLHESYWLPTEAELQRGAQTTVERSNLNNSELGERKLINCPSP